MINMLSLKKTKNIVYVVEKCNCIQMTQMQILIHFFLFARNWSSLYLPDIVSLYLLAKKSNFNEEYIDD